MPRGDGAGPAGSGPMTGLRTGYCAGYDVPGYANVGRRRGFWRSSAGVLGGGFGWRNQFYATGLPWWARRNPALWGPHGWASTFMGGPEDKEREIEMLRTEVANLEEILKEINDRLTKLSEQK